MPTENEPLDLSSGTLYLKMPADGNPALLGKVKSMEHTYEVTEYIDDLGSPAYIPMTPPTSAELSIELEPINLDPVALWRLTYNVKCIMVWAVRNRPRLVHLASYAKKATARHKNARRIVREFLQDAGMWKEFFREAEK